MKLPRDLSGWDLATVLAKLGYRVVRQTGSHMRLTAMAQGIEVHVTIPAHAALSVGTLAGILNEVATQLGITRRELEDQIF